MPERADITLTSGQQVIAINTFRFLYELREDRPIYRVGISSWTLELDFRVGFSSWIFELNFRVRLSSWIFEFDYY